MKRATRLLFFTFALIACVQLIGIEEAFCQDSATEMSCEDCATCVGHQFTGITDVVSLPAIGFSGRTYFSYSFQAPETLSLNILRPPISL